MRLITDPRKMKIRSSKSEEDVPRYIKDGMASCKNCGKKNLTLGFHLKESFDICNECHYQFLEDRESFENFLLENSVQNVPLKFVRFNPTVLFY